jgi:hypothetical protein
MQQTRSWSDTLNQEWQQPGDLEAIPHRPLPALPTQAQLDLIEVGRIAEEALMKTGKLTLMIDQIRPSDTETLGLFLDIRRTYVEVAKHHMLYVGRR